MRMLPTRLPHGLCTCVLQVLMSPKDDDASWCCTTCRHDPPRALLCAVPKDCKRFVCSHTPVLLLCARMLPNQSPHDCVLQVLMSPKDATGRDITWQSASALEGYVRRLSAVAVSLPSSLANSCCTLLGAASRHNVRPTAAVGC
jgi:hypothetical protein